ncbi:MAG: amidase [Gammaproteobacteria bacterium CG11_big_fil_rev_8_21_14_0_20_46_22]|nr:MAG: amidase [Gammaproteobacteria bacterium CG11_big_fil_rev_8_21_14_0_20_46_22]
MIKNKIRLALLCGILFLGQSVYAKNEVAVNYMDTNIATITHLIKNKKISCEQLIQSYINRIEQYDLAYTKNKPPINAIIAINPFALSQARRIDSTFSSEKNSPLLCVPVVVKDNIDTNDMPTTAGSLSLLGSQPNQDAFIVKKLRQAGAVIIGKAGMDEFASGTWGINSRLGRTGDVYDTNLLPGGSSSGVAAAVSAGFALVGIGSDNSGSLRIPAAANGVYTIRGGTGAVSQTGIFPRGNLDGIAGPIAQNIEDVAKVMDVIAVKDDQDKKTLTVIRPNSYTQFLSAHALKGKRIGIVTLYGDQKINYDGKIAGHYYQQAIQIMKQQGATIVPNLQFKQFITDRSNNAAGEVQQINAYLLSFPSTRKNFKDICESNRTRIFGTPKECLEYSHTNPRLNGTAYKKVLKNFATNRALIEAKMRQLHLDALLLPISESGVPNAKFDNQYYTILSPNSGLPAVEFIVGFTKTNPSLPIAMQFVGRQNDEANLLGMAYAFTRAIKRKPPVLNDKASSESFDTIAEFNNRKTEIGYLTYKKLIQKQGVKSVTPKAFLSILPST